MEKQFFVLFFNLISASCIKKDRSDQNVLKKNMEKEK